jgi:hypothetical protein
LLLLLSSEGKLRQFDIMYNFV